MNCIDRALQPGGARRIVALRVARPRACRRIGGFNVRRRILRLADRRRLVGRTLGVPLPGRAGRFVGTRRSGGAVRNLRRQVEFGRGSVGHARRRPCPIGRCLRGMRPRSAVLRCCRVVAAPVPGQGPQRKSGNRAHHQKQPSLCDILARPIVQPIGRGRMRTDCRGIMCAVDARGLPRCSRGRCSR